MTVTVKNQKTKNFWLAFSAVILLAFFFRFYKLADHPLGTFFDPAINGLDAIRLMQRGGHTLFFPTNGGRESLFIYLLIPFIWLFGATPFSLRVVTALIGLLNVVLLFGFLYDLPSLAPRLINLTKPLQAHRLWIATLGGLVMAVSYWPLVISRLGQRPVLVPLFSVPLFWFFLKGWASGQKRWFILAGVFMGLEGYTYSAARLLPIILVLSLVPEFLPEALRQAASSSADQEDIAGDRSPQTLEATCHSEQSEESLPGHTKEIPRFARNDILSEVNYREQLTNSLVFALVASIIYSPMAWYLVAHPGQFTARAFSVMIWNFLDTPADVIVELGRNVLRVLGFFCCTGSQSPVFGLPGQPGLNFLLSPFLLIGLMGTLANRRWLFERLMALWWLFGIAPSIIAIEAPHPLRMIVAVVPTAILVALAPFYISDFASGRVARFHSRLSTEVFNSRRWPWLVAVAALISIPGTFRAYFIDWTELPATRSTYDYEAIAVRDEILARAKNNAPIYLPLSRFNDTTLLFYLSGSFRRQAQLSAPPASEALMIAPEKYRNDSTWVRLQGQTATVLPPLTVEGQQMLQSAWSTGSEIAPGVRVGRLATDPVRFVQRPAEAVLATFGPAQLIGANYPALIGGGPGFHVTLFWQATSAMNDEYEVILHLVDDGQRAWGIGDARPTDWVYPTTFWRPGLDQIAAQHTVTLVTDGLAPGRYWLAVSLLDPATGRRLPLTEGASSAPDTFFVGPLKAPLPPPAPSDRQITARPATFGEVARLEGFTLESTTLAAGEPVQVNLLWEALRTPDVDYTVFVHLFDTDDNIVIGNDAQPVDGSYPTSIWTPGERILDGHTIPTITAQGEPLPPGQYRLAIGLYDQATGERLPVYFPDGREDPQRRLFLQTIVHIKQ